MNSYSVLSPSKGYWLALSLCMAVMCAGIYAFYKIENTGYYITDLNNAVPWGFASVMSIVYSLAAAGVLHLAVLERHSSTVARQDTCILSCLFAAALLVGGVAVALVDLGRPQNIAHFFSDGNMHSPFFVAMLINILLLVVVMCYGVALLRNSGWATVLGPVSILLQLAVPIVAGAVFSILSGGEAMQTPLMSPLFVCISALLGLACFVLLLAGLEVTAQRRAGLEDRVPHLARLLACCLVVVLFMVLAVHLSSYMMLELRNFELFMFDVRGEGRRFALFMVVGYVGFGTVLPLVLLYFANQHSSKHILVWAAGCALLGGIVLVFSLIVAPQVYPPQIFPGKIVSSSFYGQAHHYTPALPEWLMAGLGLGIAGGIVLLGVRKIALLRFEPRGIRDIFEHD